MDKFLLLSLQNMFHTDLEIDIFKSLSDLEMLT